MVKTDTKSSLAVLVMLGGVLIAVHGKQARGKQGTPDEGVTYGSNNKEIPVE